MTNAPKRNNISSQKRANREKMLYSLPQFLMYKIYWKVETVNSISPLAYNLHLESAFKLWSAESSFYTDHVA